MDEFLQAYSRPHDYTGTWRSVFRVRTIYSYFSDAFKGHIDRAIAVEGWGGDVLGQNFTGRFWTMRIHLDIAERRQRPGYRLTFL